MSEKYQKLMDTPYEEVKQLALDFEFGKQCFKYGALLCVSTIAGFFIVPFPYTILLASFSWCGWALSHWGRKLAESALKRMSEITGTTVTELKIR
jgi:hypothetical protein